VNSERFSYVLVRQLTIAFVQLVFTCTPAVRCLGCQITSCRYIMYMYNQGCVCAWDRWVCVLPRCQSKVNVNVLCFLRVVCS
jgi:hypothetical protein